MGVYSFIDSAKILFIRRGLLGSLWEALVYKFGWFFMAGWHLFHYLIPKSLFSVFPSNPVVSKNYSWYKWFEHSDMLSSILIWYSFINYLISSNYFYLMIIVFFRSIWHRDTILIGSTISSQSGPGSNCSEMDDSTLPRTSEWESHYQM